MKNYNPFPTLIFSFIGLLNELKNDVFSNNPSKKRPKHIAPSLIISGSGNYHTRKIRENLILRYPINIFYSQFGYGPRPYSRKVGLKIIKIGTVNN